MTAAGMVQAKENNMSARCLHSCLDEQDAAQKWN